MSALNPLDWPAEPFLTLYIAFLCGIAIIVFWWRSQIGHDPPGTYYGTLDALDLAWLTGGRSRAQETVLVGFLASGAAVGNVDGTILDITDHARTLSGELGPFKGILAVPRSHERFYRAIRPGLDAVQERLERNGLIPDAAAISALTRSIWMTMGIAVVVGAMKIAVGISRGKPVGILAALVVTTVLLAIAFTLAPPKRTRAGAEALAASRQRLARAARAPEPQEMALAYALSGPAVLLGTPWQRLVRPVSGTDRDGFSWALWDLGLGGHSGGAHGGGGGDSGVGSGCGGGGGL